MSRHMNRIATNPLKQPAAEVTAAKASKRLGIAAGTAAAAMVAPSVVWAAPQGGDYRGHMMWDGGWYGMILGPIMMILFIAAVVVLVVFLVRWLGGTSQSQGGSSRSGRNALDILDERFARGEIDKEDYEERRRSLER